MNKTNIEWVKNPDGSQGYTWNPITGCVNHTNGLCKGGGFPCYAYKLANGRLRQRYLANEVVAGKPLWKNSYGDEFHLVNLKDPFYPRFWEERLYLPFAGDPKGIFVCNMGELLGDWILHEWQEDTFRIIKLHPDNRFYLLTKQPQNLPKWSPFPENCYVGVTVTNNSLWNRAIENLAHIEASVKFISFEPLLSFVGNTIDREYDPNDLADEFKECGIGWVIIGAQTKPTIYPKVEWIIEIVDAADRAGVKVFLKDNLKPLVGNNLVQEMPV